MQMRLKKYKIAIKVIKHFFFRNSIMICLVAVNPPSSFATSQKAIVKDEILVTYVNIHTLKCHLS